jgi:hypothetical protein
MKVLFTILALLPSVLWADAVYAQERGNWYIDQSNSSGVLARVHGGIFSRREFMVAFEYEQNCQPVFSSIDMYERALGTLVQREALSPQQVFLTINGERHTWHGAVAEYTGGREVGIGITQQAWSALISNPRTISFTESDGQIFDVPVGGITRGAVTSILQEAASICLRRLGS